MLVNVAASSIPVCNYHIIMTHVAIKVCSFDQLTVATSMISNGIISSFLLYAKWTQKAIYARWLGDVHASIVKLILPSYSW